MFVVAAFQMCIDKDMSWQKPIQNSMSRKWHVISEYWNMGINVFAKLKVHVVTCLASDSNVVRNIFDVALYAMLCKMSIRYYV